MFGRKEGRTTGRPNDRATDGGQGNVAIVRGRGGAAAAAQAMAPPAALAAGGPLPHGAPRPWLGWMVEKQNMDHIHL